MSGHRGSLGSSTVIIHDKLFDSRRANLAVVRAHVGRTSKSRLLFRLQAGALALECRADDIHRGVIISQDSRVMRVEVDPAVPCREC